MLRRGEQLLVLIRCLTSHYHAHKVISQPELPGCYNLSFAPSATQGLNQLDRDDQPLARELRASALGLQGFAARIDDFKITDETGAITLGCKVSRASRIGHGSILGDGLVGKVVNACEAVFHLAEGDQNLLPEFGDSFLV